MESIEKLDDGSKPENREAHYGATAALVAHSNLWLGPTRGFSVPHAVPGLCVTIGSLLNLSKR